MSHEIVPVPEPGSSAQSKGLQAFLDALPNLTEAELHTLNHQVVERLRWFQETRRLLQDRVSPPIGGRLLMLLLAQ